MSKNSFWNFSYLSCFLAIILLISVIVLFEISLQVQSPFQLEIETLKKELSTARQDNNRLKNENKTLAEEAMNWMSRYRNTQHFLGDMQGDIDTLKRLSGCVDCCDVGWKIVKMGYRFQYFKEQIKCFLNE